MSYYFREKPKFDDNVSDRDDDFMQKFKQHFDEDKSFFERPKRDPFERHASFSRGFPFEDAGFGRRDIRSHLDDLAARHPEFAEHLLGSPWGEVPFSGTRTRTSGPSSQNHQDDDTRSQASGSSAASAASGASGVSSHGEPEPIFEESPSKIPQYGLRNTVDIGQHQHNMQNQDKGQSRGQRSMSAPPENRQDVGDNERPQQQETHPSQNPRFISRVDITPQFNNQTTEKSSQPTTPPQMNPQKQQQTSNVRHIPIFVEGRDKPVIPKEVEESAFTKQQSPPPRFHPSHFEAAPPPPPPPHFHRPSHFTSERGFGSRPREWTQFREDPFQNPFDHGIRRTQSPFRQQTERPSKVPESHFSQGQHTYQQPPHSQSSHPHHQQQQQQQPQSESQPQKEPVPEPIKRKPILPKDPLERVAIVQKEVDSLTEQVKLWNGTSRKDKQYIYLDEMLTRELIKLDDIETEGKEAVRQARKNAIKSIQDSISLLESKAPLPGQTPMREEPPQLEQTTSEDKGQENIEPMETEKKPEEEDKPIPLQAAAAPSSPTKESSDLKNESQTDLQQSNIEEAVKMEDNLTLPDPNIAIPMESSSPAESSTAMEVQTETEETTTNEEMKDTKQDEKIQNEVPKSAKKVKKTKKQVPVSTEPIPLPGPEPHHTDVK